MPISILMYKQRFRNPNFKTTAGANYAHVRYIATRPRVMRNEGMDHGLFGKLEPGAVKEFEDWKDVARLVYGNSRKHITMYRSIISFTAETAEELMLKDQKSWQRYIENHIMTIAEKNNIRREHLQWACAAHNEKGHPHIHVVFWDTSRRVKNPFTPPAVPNAIRRQMIKDTFPEKIREFGRQKDMAVSAMRKISDELVEDFVKHMRIMDKSRYKHLCEASEGESEMDFDFEDRFLNEIANQVLRIRNTTPQKGRIAYQLLPVEVKTAVDSLVQFILKENPAIKSLVDDYVQSKLNLTKLYTSDEDYIKNMEGKFRKEAEKIIANRILGMVKSLNRLDNELKSEEYIQSRRAYYAAQMLYEILDMLSSLTYENNNRYNRYASADTGDLSKEAKKELFLKNQDKGYEH